MNKALQRPTNSFYTKQASAKPKQVDKYEAWLNKEDPRLIDYIDDLAVEAARRAFNKVPFKRPKLKGFEKRYFDQVFTSCLSDYELQELKDQAEVEARLS